jgi:2-aminoethylphosphonate aminotransferase
MRSVKRNILLNPGPATTTDAVKYAQVVPDICPREAEFGALMEAVCGDLTGFVGDAGRYATVLFGGSGTAAVESIISSVVGPHAAVIVNNGKRMCEIAEAYGLPYMEFRSPADQPVDLAALERCIGQADRRVTHLAVVHHETTTGLLTDIRSIGDLCRRLHLDLIVDAISSYGAVPIRMEDMNISYLAASSNKNLQGMPGVAFVVADKGKLAERPQAKPGNYYLNLHDQYRHFSQTRQMRFTPPVQTLYALKQAIGELKREGVQGRYDRYSKSWETLCSGLARLGLETLIDRRHHSKLLTSVIEPDNAKYDFQEMHDYFYERGFTIYPGKLERLNTFRIANIGDITHRDLGSFLELLERYLKRIGHPCERRSTQDDIAVEK